MERNPDILFLVWMSKAIGNFPLDIDLDIDMSWASGTKFRAKVVRAKTDLGHVTG